MQKVLTAEEMREVDRLTTEKYGIPSIILMENAAHASARVIAENLGGSVEGKSFLILCGKGNNGGDGAALGRILWQHGAWKVWVVLFGKVEETKGDARINFEIIQKIYNWEPDAPLIYFEEIGADKRFDLLNLSKNFDVIVDAVLGTGLTRKLEGDLKQLATNFNRIRRLLMPRLASKRPLLVSLDIPSGINSDLHEPVGQNFNADLTITFTAPKLANVLPPASHFAGELCVAEIGSPEHLVDETISNTFVAEKSDAKMWLMRSDFTNDSYKNKRGHALLIVGSREYTGAAVLAGNAAMVSGVGLTTIATSESAQTVISEKTLEEIIVRGLAENEKGAIAESAYSELEKLFEKVDVIGIGSGLRVPSPESQVLSPKTLVEKVVENRKTSIVIDADGLNGLSPFSIEGSDEFPLILTPHEGEFLRLLGTNDNESIKDRGKAVRDFAQKHKVILVLKGERVLIGAPDGRVVVNPTGNSGLGKAGNGDTLTGIITGFIAQAVQMKVDIFQTVVAAVYCAGLAGDIAEKKFGKRAMLASDVRDCLVEAFREIES